MLTMSLCASDAGSSSSSASSSRSGASRRATAASASPVRRPSLLLLSLLALLSSFLLGAVADSVLPALADFAQHHIDSLDLTVNSVTYLQRMFPGMTEQQYRQHLGAFGITVRPFCALSHRPSLDSPDRRCRRAPPPLARRD